MLAIASLRCQDGIRRRLDKGKGPIYSSALRVRSEPTLPCPIPIQRSPMPTYKVVTQKSPEGTFDVAGGTFTLEMEALGPVGVEIVETAAESEDEFIAAARDADAIMARGRQMTAKIINSLERCRVIALGSVGADSVDVDAATARGIPVTNVPDIFIEEVADHAMTLILATFRRVLVQDRMARDGRWAPGPAGAVPDTEADGSDAGICLLRARGQAHRQEGGPVRSPNARL